MSPSASGLAIEEGTDRFGQRSDAFSCGHGFGISRGEILELDRSIIQLLLPRNDGAAKSASIGVLELLPEFLRFWEELDPEAGSAKLSRDF